MFSKSRLKADFFYFIFLSESSDYALNNSLD